MRSVNRSPSRHLVSRLKLSKEGRFCCHVAPYEIRQNGVCHDVMIQLRVALEQHISSRSTKDPSLACDLLIKQSSFNIIIALLSGYAKPKPSSRDNVMRVLPKCKRCRSLTLHSLLFEYDDIETSTTNIESFTPTLLHLACLLPHPTPLVKRLLLGCPTVNEVNVLGQTPLHVLLLGDTRSSSLEETMKLLLSSGADVSATDKRGETALLYIRNLLREQLYLKASEVANILLEAGAVVDHANKEGQTLLAYSIQHLDNSLQLTLTLLNHGASLWGTNGTANSAFAWLLQTVLARKSQENFMKTRNIICDLMSMKPGRLYQHAIQCMLRQSEYPSIDGPVLQQFKNETSSYRYQPKRLTHLCRNVIRSSLVPQRIFRDVNSLNIPVAYKEYILLNNSALGEEILL